MKEINIIVAQVCVFSYAYWVRNYPFRKNYSTSEGAFSHNVFYYQQIFIDYYQVSCYAKKENWGKLPIVPETLETISSKISLKAHSSSFKNFVSKDLV